MPITLEIYINGTSMDASRGRPGLAQKAACERQKQGYKTHYIPGCNINTPYKKDLGGIFAWNLETQIGECVEKIIQPQLRDCALKNEKLILKIYGLSRGGVGAFLLCKALKEVSPEKLEIHLATIDPAPGNLKITAWLDKFFRFNYTLANQAADLRECKNLKRSIIFIGSKPHRIGHACLLPIMPESCDSSIEIVNGYHEELENQILVTTQLDIFWEVNTPSNETKTTLLEAYEYACKEATQADRGMHLSNVIITKSSPERIYWNKNHQALIGTELNTDTCICQLKDPVSHPHTNAHLFKEVFENVIWFLKIVILFPITLAKALAEKFKKKPPKSETEVERATRINEAPSLMVQPSPPTKVAIPSPAQQETRQTVRQIKTQIETQVEVAIKKNLQK